MAAPTTSTDTAPEHVCYYACTTGCYNGQYARPITYDDGRVDHITINCACKGQPCGHCPDCLGDLVDDMGLAAE